MADIMRARTHKHTMALRLVCPEAAGRCITAPWKKEAVCSLVSLSASQRC